MRLLKLIIELETPLHCGSGAGDWALDQPVARDTFGLWRIPGTSLAGSLRALAATRDKDLANRLFGDQKEAKPSLVWCRDALLLDFDGVPALKKKLAGKEVNIPLGPFVRDHVRLNLQTGTSEEGAKFDEEIVPAGTRFLLDIRLDGWQNPLSPRESEFFDLLCADMCAGTLRLGGKSNSGYGAYKEVRRQYLRIDLSTTEGMVTWLNLDPWGEIAGEKDEPLPAPAGININPGLNGFLTIPLQGQGPILIGGGSLDPDGSLPDEDIVFALSPFMDYSRGCLSWRYVLPGSSLKGVFRHRIYDILTLLGMQDKNATSLIDNLFGSVKNGAGRAGKIQVRDGVIAGGKAAPVSHVTIDRFSGGTVQGALFKEKPLWADNYSLNLRLDVNEVEAHEAALLFHALLDFCEGDVSVGSGANRGNGRFVLPGWPKNQREALDSIKGELVWEGKPLSLDQSSLQIASRVWDEALENMVKL